MTERKRDPGFEKNCWRWLPVFDDEDRENLNRYQYRGTDNGFTYKYFYNPLCNYLVEKLPETLAPNCITLIGAIHSYLPVLLVFIVGGIDFVGTLPSWIIWLEIYCFLAYKILDELDGK